MTRRSDKVVALKAATTPRVVHRFDDGAYLEDTDDGLVLCEPRRGKDGDSETIGGETAVTRERVTHTRFIVAAESKPAPGTAGAHGFVLEHGPRAAPCRYAVPAGFAHKPGNVLLENLANLGVKIDTKHTRTLVRYIAQARPEQCVTAYDRTGWQTAPSVFVLGERRIIGDSDGVFQPTATAGAAVLESGTLTEWIERVAAPACVLPWWRWCLVTAFAAPILRLLDAEGFSFHAFGQSSQGKTAGGRVCASVWGRGAGANGDGYLQTWASTANGIEGTAEAHNDLPLVLDELAQADGRAVYSVVYALSNGAGKLRMQSDATMRRQKTWRVVAISTGEVMIEAKLAEARTQHKAGMTVRIVELPIDGTGILQTIDTEHVRSLEASTMKVFGRAGPAFIERLLADRYTDPESAVFGDLRATVADIERELVSPTDDARHRRAAKNFAIVAAAGELAVRFRLLPAEADPRETARMLYRVWRDQGGGELGTDDHRRAADRLLELIEASYGTTITAPKEPARGARLGWSQDGEVFLLDQAVSTALDSVPTRAFLHAAARRGALVVTERGRLKSKLRTDAGFSRGYRFDIEALRAWVHGDSDTGDSDAVPGGDDDQGSADAAGRW